MVDCYRCVKIKRAKLLLGDSNYVFWIEGEEELDDEEMAWCQTTHVVVHNFETVMVR